MDSNWLELHEAGNTHANLRCSPRGGGRRFQAVALVSCVSIDPLSFAGSSVAKHSSESNSDLARARNWSDLGSSGLASVEVDGLVHEQGLGNPQDKEVQDDWACTGPGEPRALRATHSGQIQPIRPQPADGT
jgi:hypothetical protein